MQLSVTIIAKNAEKTLSQCLNAANQITDDIVLVIDDSTTDKTFEIAKKFKVKIYLHKFTNFSQQKNFAASKAKYDWVFSLDSDEIISNPLAEEINSFELSPNVQGIRIPRINIIFSKKIFHTNWDPNPILRIYNRNIGQWSGDVHEEIVNVKHTNNFKGKLIHYNYYSVEHFLDKQNLYSTFLSSESVKHFYLKLFWNPIYEFGRRFIWHKGFLDGWHGLFLSYLMAIYQLTVLTKKWERSMQR